MLGYKPTVTWYVRLLTNYGVTQECSYNINQLYDQHRNKPYDRLDMIVCKPTLTFDRLAMFVCKSTLWPVWCSYL